MSSESTFGISGLTADEVAVSRSQHGRNEVIRTGHPLLDLIKSIATDPMVVLLLIAAAIYFVGGAFSDGIFMACAIAIVSGISIYQEHRSRNALAALADLTQPKSRVIRDGIVQTIAKEDVVVGDCIIVDEGVSIPADGIIIHSHDFSLNEAILTGESLPVSKQKDDEDNRVYQGTTVVGGLAVCRVTETGSFTRLGKIATGLQNIKQEHSPLQVQMNTFVRRMAFVGVAVFMIVLAVNFLRSREFLDSLLRSLTLAMSILPEEIPVAFTTFMALGAWRLAQHGIIVKRVATIETLGSATVICTDKTGTITENRMALASMFSLSSNMMSDPDHPQPEHLRLIEFAMWASEPAPFDPMEKALHAAYEKSAADRRSEFKMIHEYPLGGRPPMMTHIFENVDGVRIIAAKGAPEAILRCAQLSPLEQRQWSEALIHLSDQGYRVLGVAEGILDGDVFPADQFQFKMKALGLVAFYDPPKENMRSVLRSFYDAGIDVKIITGDNANTTATIAQQVGLRGSRQTMDGNDLITLTDNELMLQTRNVNIFTRMFPEAKLRILNALKTDGHIVAMTGDGVNDAPALKAADIGIAMGKKGSETAKEVSALVLTDDDLAGMVKAIGMGRKIYANLKKAIRYVISIHIPIILTVFVPLIFGWTFPAIFSPIHVIFLELIMGPTCSIIYENEPMSVDAMSMKPRPLTATFFSPKELATSIVQGLAISAGVLAIYQYADGLGCTEQVTRSMVFLTLVSANIFLTLVNRSFHRSVLKTFQLKNRLMTIVIMATVIITALLFVIPGFRQFFQFDSLSYPQVLISVAVGCASVVWYEIIKMLKRRNAPRTQ